MSTAADGEEALRVANEKTVGCDPARPAVAETERPEVLKALKSNPATQAIPVIVVSCLSQKNEEKLKQAGAVAYFEKATLDLEKHPDRLASAVESILRRLERQETGSFAR